MHPENKNKHPVETSRKDTRIFYGAGEKRPSHDRGERIDVGISGHYYSVMDLMKIIMSKGCEIDTTRIGMQDLWNENVNLKRRLGAAIKIVPPCEVKHANRVKSMENEIEQCKREV